MMFVVVENQKNGVIRKHKYSSFDRVRDFCSVNLPQYNPHWAMATVISALEESNYEFTIINANPYNPNKVTK